jgi:spermidine/putrescine transport system substrate-binding protein
MCWGNTLAESLTIFNWEDFLSERVVASWEQGSGHSLTQVYFDSDEERDTIVASQKSKKIDLTILDQVAATRLGKEGFLLPKPDVSEFPAQTKIDPRWKNSCGDYAIPYLWGTLGVAYRTDKLPNAPTSWNDLLSPAPELVGHIGLFEDYTDLLAPPLLMAGYSINTQDEKELKYAFAQIRKILRSVLTFEYPISFVGTHPDSDKLYLTLAYSGDQYALNERTGDEVWQYTTLKEGSVIWIDCIAILANSQRKDAALSFLNHLYTPENAAMNSEDVYVATPIPEAKARQSQEFQKDTSVYPPQSVLEKSQQYTTLSTANIYLRNRITSSLVKLHDSQ